MYAKSSVCSLLSMSDNWDFSSLLSSWTEKSTNDLEQDNGNNDEFADIQEQMKKELDEIQSQLVLVRSNDPTVLNELNLLSPPKLQTQQFATEQFETQNQIPNQTPSRSSTSLASISNKNKNSISNKSLSNSKLPPLTKSSLGPLPKPKEAMLMKPKRTIVQKIIPKPERIFKATPTELRVVNFTLSKEYVLKFTLQNVSSRTHGFQVNGPKDPAFRFKILENINNSQVRPGLHLTFEVTFIPTEPRDYEGSIIIHPGPDDPSTVIPIRCYRDPPQLVLNDIVDLQATLVHSSISGSFTITNRGGVASFSITSAHGRDDSSSYIDGPFTLIPSQFQLDRGQSIDVKVKFKPTTAGMQKASFEINAQFFPQKFYFITQGLAAVPRLRFKICDDDRLFLPFLPSDANTTRSIEIYNDSDVSYPFYLQIVRPKDSTKSELKVLFPDTKTDSIKSSSPPFIVKPVSGFIGARDTISLNVTFSPKMFAFYRANLVLFANRIPDESGTLGSRKMLTISTEATAGPPQLSIQPPLVLYKDIVPRVSNTQVVEVLNESNLNIKLQWRKSEVISPSPVIFEVNPKQRKSVELCFLFSKCIASLLSNSTMNNSSIFQNNPKIDEKRQCFSNEISFRKNNDENRINSQPSSQNYAINFSPLSKKSSRVNQKEDESIAPQETVANNNNDDDNDNTKVHFDDKIKPNIVASKLKKSLSYKESHAAIAPSPVSTPAHEDQVGRNVSHLVDSMSINVNEINQMSFTFSANIMKPNLIVEPPVLEFGCVLIGQKGIQNIRLINPTECPIGYKITYPQTAEWNIENNSGVIESSLDLAVELKFDKQTTLAEIITINSFWIGENGEQIESLPTSTYDIPVYAVFDKPFLSIEKRVIDIGDIYPTLEYKSRMKIKLLNTFPTDFSFDNYSNVVCLTTRPLSAPKEKEAKEENIVLSNRESAPVTIRSKSQASKKTKTAKNSQRPSTVTLAKHSDRIPPIAENNDDDIIVDNQNDDDNNENNDDLQKTFDVLEYIKTEPVSGRLEYNDSCDIDISSNFCNVGDVAHPFVCNVNGNSYTCAVVAHVHPPKLVLQTPMIDFSSDFRICKRSSSFVIVENECEVSSTVRLEMIDDCNGVFSLDDPSIKEISGKGKVEIPISCYSEIHGDYKGQLKLIVKDSWQRKESIINMHVKALGSFFGFMKHTLGYTIGKDGDFVSFGNKIKVGSEKVIRRITLENFSSDEITVDWSIANFVKGRHYVDVKLDVDDSGLAKIEAVPTEEGAVMDPFKLLSEKTIIEAHNKTVVVVEFTPDKVGEFRGCIAAKSGEFTHSLDLLAIVCD